MSVASKDLGHGTTAMLLLVSSYIALGIALFGMVDNAKVVFCSVGSTTPVINIYTIGAVLFIALLLWMLAIYTAGLGRGKDEHKFMAAFTSYCAFIPVLVLFACYMAGVSPLEIIGTFSDSPQPKSISLPNTPVAGSNVCR